MLENNLLVGLSEGHMHSSSLEAATGGHSADNGVANNNAIATAADGGVPSEGTDVSKGYEALYDEPEDPTGERQTLIQNRYCFWYYRKGSQKESRDPSEAYESGIKAVDSFQTVEHFWRIYNHILRADQVPNATDLHLFRDGIKPTWEDPSNSRGGQLLIRLKKGLTGRAWESLILAIIGEQFDVGNEICGAVVSIRYSEDVISVWNRSASNAESIDKIRETVKRLLHIPPFVQLEYRRHQDNLGAANVREERGGGFSASSPGFGPRGGASGTGGTWTRNRAGGPRGLGGGGGIGNDHHHKDGDRGGPSAGGMPQETWARGPPEARDRDRDAGGFRGGGGGGFRAPPGRWGDRRAAEEGGAGGGGGGKDYGGGAGERGEGGSRGFGRGDRSDREKDLEKWGKVRKDPNSLRDRERDRDRERGSDSNFRDRSEFRERETADRDWGKLRRVSGPPPGVHGGSGGGMRGGGDGDRRRDGGGGGGLERLERHSSLDDGKGRDWGKLRQGTTPASPDREKR